MKMKQPLHFSGILLAGLIAIAAPVAQAKSDTGAATPQVLVGAFPSPPMGAGPGKLTVMHLPDSVAQVVDFGQAGTPTGNSFYVAVDSQNNQIFVPSVAGTTNVIDLRTDKLVRQFKSIPGGRVAIVSPDHNMVFVLSGQALAAYSTSDDALRYQVPVGGNALAFNTDGSRLYVGGNMNETITDIDPSSGHIKNPTRDDQSFGTVCVLYFSDFKQIDALFVHIQFHQSSITQFLILDRIQFSGMQAINVADILQPRSQVPKVA